MERRYRRSRHLVCYWTDQGPVVYNYATAMQAPATELMWQLLDFCSDWRSAEQLRLDLARGLPDDVSGELFEAMVAATFFEASNEPRAACEEQMEAWRGWNPAAGFFHTASRQCVWGDQTPFGEKLSAKHRITPMPSSVRPPRAERVPLPEADRSGAFADVLLARRTWRQFGSDPIERATFARVLQLTSGVTHWLEVPGLGEVPLTTSPSGGARHPIETYVAVRHVRDVAPGIYRYAPDRHEIEVAVTEPNGPDFGSWFPQQPWFGRAAFAVFFAAVFERTGWRYEFPLAYRAVLLEAGHMCQTFLLTATALGLAPFSTMAIDAPRLETALGLDGISEAVLYAAGAGSRPATTARVVLPAHQAPAATRPNGRSPASGPGGPS
jgi:SagB-type dehydrogenase family enzyme